MSKTIRTTVVLSVNTHDKLKMMSKRKFNKYREDLIDNAKNAELEFKRKHKE